MYNIDGDMRAFVVLIFALSLGFCTSEPEKNPNRDPYSLETLLFLEEVLLDVWENPSAKDEAMSRLRYVCRTKDTDDGYLCYMWGLLEYHRGNYADSYTGFRKALEKNPNDTLYKNMLRISAEKSGNLGDLKAHSYDGEVLATVSELQKQCRENQSPSLPTFQFLIERGVFTKDSLRHGSFAICFQKLAPDEQIVLQKLIKNPNVSYKERLFADQMKSDPFTKIWDTSSYYRGELGKEMVGATPGAVTATVSSNAETNPKSTGSHNRSEAQITQAWRKVKLAILSGNEAQAKEALRQFLAEVQIVKRKGKTEALMATALERAAKLLIEQDPQFTQFRSLAKEL
ncbi:hypothetical protein [Leptospira biflexa]|uniref:hypothetical protein n=1 Tax=Leptospira biflexa TaxID=172 RepID=UPI00108393A0|nr:hypothetical protein [Leptospira biflexa]TGM37905.1 hypothetical protein EHQ80_10055 [Leptospira biflexa]TGM41236.1 hypothetical protein EHQ89_04620 [Leptospira biflexa]TGM55363.1 hypothetical protein EHQ91_10530 [Leptospira biflexa]